MSQKELVVFFISGLERRIATLDESCSMQSRGPARHRPARRLDFGKSSEKQKNQRIPNEFGPMPRSAKPTRRDVEAKLVLEPSAEYPDGPEADSGSKQKSIKIVHS